MFYSENHANVINRVLGSFICALVLLAAVAKLAA